jgi:hypothetical protein
VNVFFNMDFAFYCCCSQSVNRGKKPHHRLSPEHFKVVFKITRE